jgi:hypothetical protein
MLDSINIKYWQLAHTSDELGYHRDNDYTSRCDICGDSSSNKNKKRLHLYRKNGYDNDSIKCFNCDYTGNMYAYLRDYHPDLFNSYKQEIQQDKLGSLGTGIKNLLVVRAVQKTNTLFTFDKPDEFIDIQYSIEGLKYITSRGFPNLKCYFSRGEVNLRDKKVKLENYIIIPLLENNKWYGFYSRSINSKTFYTYLPEENSGWKIWNWFSINKKEPVYIFEAIFNAMSSGLKNSIAVLGSDLDDNRLKELSTPVFCFDNDETGRKKALKYTEMGYKVVILHRDIKDDFNDMFKKGMKAEQISELILNNTYSGLKAKILLKV